MKLNIQLFASSGTIDGSSTASNATCRILWTQTPGTSQQNYSTIYAEVQLYKSGSSSTTGTFSGVININDVEYSISKKFSPYRWGNWATVGSATATVPHNSDGTKSCTISTYFTNSGTSMAGEYRTPYPNYITLDTIPRGSTFNTSSWNRDTQRQMNSTLSFPATQNVSGVYHKLVAKFMNNGTETTICTRTGVSISGGYISFSFSNGELSTIYNLMPNETTHYIRMYLYTYTNSSYTNQLGDVSILWWTGAIPSSIVPSASFTSYVEGGDVPSAWGVWVKGKSKANLTLTGTGVYSSTISAYSISGDGYTYNTSPVLTNYLSQAGNITFTGIVTDSRGRTGTATTTLSVVDYTNPTISTAQVQRCDVDGNIDNNGEYVYISYGASISSCSGENTPNAVYKVGYRINNTGDYTYIPLTTNANSYSATGMLYTDGIFAADRGSGTKLQLSTSNTYDIQLFVSDYFTNSTSLQILDTGFDLMNFNASGKSMAIGKVSEAGANEELLEIGMETFINGGVKITGSTTLKGRDFVLGTENSTSNDSSDIVWNYGNGDEKARVWTDNVLDIGNPNLNYRSYDDQGNLLYQTKLLTSNFIKIVHCVDSVTVPGETYTNFTLRTIPTITNFTFIGVLPQFGGFTDQWLTSISGYGSDIVAMIYSKFPSALTQVLTYNLLYIRDDNYNEAIQV